MKDCRSLTIAALCLTLLAACGYRLAGSGRLPGDVSTIAVSVLTNRTALSGLESIVTNALVDEFTRRRQNLLVDADRADAVLTGSIDALATETVARSGTLTALQRRMVITASLVLKNRNGLVLWEQQITAEETYTVDALRPETDRNLRLASAQAAQRLAEYAYARLTDTF
ncbi:MAG: hypothetical protein C4519_22600 [Desulfobacteraceae bacterium]|nr:MAG: hypothetical protein C4519_22600 [Desulfobacteraceae bacterium]